MNTRKQSFQVLAMSVFVIVIAYVVSVSIHPQTGIKPETVQVTTVTGQPTGQTIKSSVSSSPIPTESVAFSSQQSASRTFSDAIGYTVNRHNEQIAVNVTVDNSVITGLSVTNSKSDPTSASFQGSFENSIRDLVVGKNIHEVELASVGGASFTTAAFMEAINRIKNNI